MEGKALAFLVSIYTSSLVSHKPVHSIGNLPERFNAPTINFSMSNISGIQNIDTNGIYCNLAFSFDILKPFPADICSSPSFFVTAVYCMCIRCYCVTNCPQIYRQGTAFTISPFLWAGTWVWLRWVLWRRVSGVCRSCGLIRRPSCGSICFQHTRVVAGLRGGRGLKAGFFAM